MNDTTKLQDMLEAGKKRELKGVGGWLLIRILAYLIVWPLSLLNQFSYLALVQAAIVFAAAILLIRLKPLGVTLAKVGEGFSFFVGLIFLVMAAASKPNDAYLLAQAGFRPVIFGGIWLTYFCVSKRVKATYYPVTMIEFSPEVYAALNAPKEVR